MPGAAKSNKPVQGEIRHGDDYQATVIPPCDKNGATNIAATVDFGAESVAIPSSARADDFFASTTARGCNYGLGDVLPRGTVKHQNKEKQRLKANNLPARLSDAPTTWRSGSSPGPVGIWGKGGLRSPPPPRVWNSNGRSVYRVGNVRVDEDVLREYSLPATTPEPATASFAPGASTKVWSRDEQAAFSQGMWKHGTSVLVHRNVRFGQRVSCH